MDLRDELAAVRLRSHEPAKRPGIVQQRRGLWPAIKSDWDANGRDWSRPGLRALVVYRFGVWRMAVKPAPLRKLLSVVYHILERRIRRSYGIELPYSAGVGHGVVIEHQNGIVIHGSASIGDRCVIRQGVTIGNRGVDDPLGAPILGNDVDVGANAVIIGRVRIGDGVRVGAGAVVVKDVPAGATVVGNPAVVRLAKQEGPTAAAPLLG